MILLVDCAVDGTGTSTIASSTTTALSLCQAILQGRIRDTVKYKVGKRNGVGIILFDTKALSSSKSSKSNTPKENNDNDNDNDDDDASSEDDDDNEEDDATPPLHVHVLMDLEPPGIASVQTIRQWLAQPKEFQSKFGCSKDDSTTTTSHTTTIPPLQTALEEAMLQFRSAKCVKTFSSSSGGGAQQQQQQQVDTKSIWILTHRECPISDLGAQSRLQTIARDFHEQEIEIVVWPLLAAEHENDEKETPSPPPPPLDMSLFYDSIVTQDVFEGRRLSHHTNDDLEDELEGLQSFWKKIRRLYWGPLLLPGQSVVDNTSDNENETDDNDSSSLSPNNTIMVDWYRFVQLAKRPTKVQFDQATKRYVDKLSCCHATNIVF